MDAGTPSAAYLQARINTLTLHLRSRLKNLINLTKPPKHRTITSTATDELRMDVESTALIRAAEEVMVLTRELKDLWLFGGLNTLREGDGVSKEQWRIDEDASIVYEYARKVLALGGGPAEESAEDASTAVKVEVQTP